MVSCAILFAIAEPVAAQSLPRPFPISGYDLQEACVAVEAPPSDDPLTIATNAILAAQCWSQIDGFFSGVRLQTLRAREEGLRAPFGASCVPDNLDMPALREVLLQYIERTPSARTQRAGIALALAFETTFPC
ncbi:Rap1a/Tai family immunity protein [Vitreimonas sp.]|uniref:Rap1a/Tai family immunity protein n=1 Tax=Vitreimonas sp. TaxID=3069702 RepID=UPI0039C8CF06